MKGPTYSYMKIGHISQNRVHRLQTNVELHGHGDIGMAQGQHFSENIKRPPDRVQFLKVNVQQLEMQEKQKTKITTNHSMAM